MSDLVVIDGSFGEGGGQVLRTSLSLSAITGRPLEISNIRGKRSKPGLQPQHLAAVRAAAAICGATVRGDAQGSVYLRFEPSHPPRADEYRFDIGTAGATTLVAQTVLVPLSLAGGVSQVTIKGGTHNPMAPTADYLEHVYAATLVQFGFDVTVGYGPAGFYPKGGGELHLTIGPANPRPFALTDRTEGPLRAVIMSNGLPPSVADRGEQVLHAAGKVLVEKRVENALSTGIAVTLFTGHAGFSSLGERGKPMERVTAEAVNQWISWNKYGKGVDEHLADQLVLPALYAPGRSEWRTNHVTEHLRTVLWVAGQFCEMDYKLGEEGLVTIEKMLRSPIPQSGCL